MGSMAYAPLQLPENKLQSLPHYHVDSQSPAWTSTTQDPYYSNEDIEILHEIVSIAQEKLNDPNGARPLPAAALFKAYDEVLPKHGIDPDDENHLSRLIFRVGGEKGCGSLPEKFQAVLASMGIALEYGDCSPASQRASRSSHSSSDDPNHFGIECLKPSSASERLNGNLGELFTPWPSATEYEDESIELEPKPAARCSPLSSIPRPNLNSYPSLESVLSGPSQPQGSQQSIQRWAGHSSTQPVMTRPEAPTENIPEFSDPGKEMPMLRAALTRPSVLAILDRWHSASKNRQIRKASLLPLSDRMASPTIDTQRLAGPDTRESWQIKSPRATLFLTRHAESSISVDTKQPTVKSPLLPSPTAHHRLEAPREEEIGHHGDYTALLNRAGRAREIYLASRAFNHWAEITAARLEKEAVARRHMIRFRCFRGWSNAPNSRAPVVNHLRAATAVQKLRRAVACQEEQLRAAASVIYETYRIHKAKRAMCQWLCSTAQQSIRHETAHRAKRGIVRLWNNLATLHQKQAELTAKKRQCIQKKHLIHHWASKAQLAERQLAVSKQVGLARPMFAHLAAWWDHSEIEKRAQVYSANLFWRRAHSALDNWNLRARTQAFVWRSDYQSATCALTKWIRVIENGRTQQCRAACAIERCQVPAALGRVEHFVDYMSKFEYYAYRARLFIMASRFLQVLDRAYEARKASRKEEIRQQLRARYKEVSSTRKKRQFHSALHLWRSSAQRYTSVAAEAKEHLESQTRSLKLDAVQIWLAAASQNEEQRATGQKHAVHYVLSNWGELFEQLAQQDAQSWNMWVQRKQRQALKSWSISSLQGSGRGHTASMVQQRHNADKRSRAFQIWRYSRQVLEATDAGHPSVTPHHQVFNGRRSWKTISTRKSTAKPDLVSQDLRAFNTPAAPLDTPTRWTGRPLPMSSTLANPSTSFREVDEQSATSSRFSDEAGTGYDLAPSTRKPRQVLHRGLVLRPDKSASTTPQVPVPTDLRRSIQVRNTAFNKSAISTISEQSFQPNTSLIQQREAGEKQLPGYTDSTITNGVSARLVSRSQIYPTENWRGPTIPSRQSMRNAVRSEFRTASSDGLRAAKTAPQSSRFAGGGRRKRLHDDTPMNKADRPGVVAGPRIRLSTSVMHGAPHRQHVSSPKTSRAPSLNLETGHIVEATVARKSANAKTHEKTGSMSAVLPGKPQSRLQGFATGLWANRHVKAYITGSALTILDDPQKIIQAIYDENDDELEAIAFDDASGKIAVCTTNSIRVYRPSARPEDPYKWALEASFETPQAATGESFALSWGREEELLAASSALSLYSTKEEIRCSWQKSLPNKAKVATLSYDSAYIASVSHHDKLPKVWRRLAYGRDEVRFDHSYLPHPDVVTMVRWRRPFHVDQSASNVLYTFCLDGLVRIWATTETADGQHWQLWGSININAASSGLQSDLSSWIVCIVDGREFMPCVEHLVQVRMSDDPSTDEVAMEHLVAVANKTPEVCLAINCNGIMSAWAIDSVGNNSPQGDRVFNIAQVRSPAFESLEGFTNLSEVSHIEAQSYFDKQSGQLALLLHSFDGRIGVFYSDVANLFSPTTNDHRIALQTVWSGHSAPVTKINRNFSGRAVVSRTETGECIVWKHPEHRSAPNAGLNRRSVITHPGHILRVCVLRKGRFVVFLDTDSVSLWDCRSSRAYMLAKCSTQWSGTALCLIALPRAEPSARTKAHISMITSERTGIVWEVSLPVYARRAHGIATGRIDEFCRFELDVVDGLKYVLPVDPAGKTPVASGFLDVFARDVAISYTRSGCVNFWTARVDLQKQRVDWLSTCCTETGMEEPALASGSTLKKAALVNSSRSQLTIWDIGGSRLEFEEIYDTHNLIRDLDWTSTPDGQSILAVGFPYRVILLSQMRFDYLNQGPAWAQIREISIRELTPHPIGDSTWLGDGHLVIGAGNQLFVQDRLVNSDDANMLDIRLPQRRDGSWDIFEAVQRFNGPLPIFHPQFLSQCVLSGKGLLVGRILKSLHKILKYTVPGDPVDDYVGLDVTEIYERIHVMEPLSKKGQVQYLSSEADEHDDEEEPFQETTANSLNESLKKVRIPQLSGHEQIQLMDMIECAAFVEKHRRSMDENGARFMLFFRQHALRKGRTSEIQLSWREIDWAFHSTTQDILIGFVARQTHGPMLWKHARESGLFMWITDVSTLRAQFENVARNEYTHSETKSPVDCSLFYLALKKKTVLQGLWRMAVGNKEQAATQRLLLNNFEEDRWKTVAQKNAYALLGKRRFQYAAAFFLLAGRLGDAVEVCLRQLKDIQLAIAVTRVYEGDSGPILRKLLQDEVLPLAAQEGDRWLASWAFWMLGRKDMAVRALITPVYTLLETPTSPDFRSRLFLTDDPALVVLYGQLRHKSLQTLRGASKVNPRVEWEFVLHSAKIYDRMGCDLLGLDLVRNWEFQQPSAAGIGGEANPLKLLRRRSSLVVNDLPLMQLQTGLPDLNKRGAKREAPAPTTFEEPDAGSLLDSFGL